MNTPPLFRHLLLLLMSCAMPLVTSAATPSYSVVDLEFPGSNYFPRVTSINNKNQVVGWTSDSSGGGDKIWIYLPEPEYGYPAGVTVIPIPNRNAYAYSINDHGVIGGFVVDTSSFPQRTRAMIFQNGAVTSEFNFTADAGDGSTITSISNSGYICGYTRVLRQGSTSTIPTIRVAVVRNPSQSIFTNPVTFNSGTFASQINSEGKAAADLILNFKSRGGTFDGAFQPIGPEAVSAEVRRPATDINEKGQVVGLTAAGECYLNLPEADYGLAAGLHVLFVTGGAPVINDVGQIMTTTHFWDKGDLYPLSDILPEGETRQHTGALPSGILSGVKGINNYGNAVTSFIDNATNETSISLLLAKPVSSLTVDIVADDPKHPLRAGDTGVATIRVEHPDTDPLTYSFPNGLVVGSPDGALEFEPLALIRPFTLSRDDRVRQFEVTFTAHEIGSATVTSTLAISGPPDLLVAQAEVPVLSAGDLLIKRVSQPATAFGENDVYQTSPRGQQREKISVLEDETAHFDIRVDNDNTVPASFHVTANEDPNDQWTTAYFLGSADITAAILSDDGYSTGELAPGASLLIRAHYTPVTAVDGGEKKALIRLADDDDNIVDVVEAIAKRSDIVLFLTMHQLDLAGLTDTSVMAGDDDIDAPLIPETDTTALDSQKEVLYGLVADGVTPLLFRIEADPQLLEDLDEDLEVKLAATAESGGSLANGNLATRLRVLKDGAWLPGDTVTLTEEEPVTFAYITPIPSDDLNFSSRPGEIGSLLEARNIDTDEEIESLEFYLRKPPIILVHGYNTAGDWGSAFQHVLHESRPPNKISFVRTGRYGQQIGSSGVIKDQLNKANAAYVNSIFPLRNLVPMASAQAFDREFDVYDGFWAVTRHDVIAHSQGGVLARMLCSQADNQHLPRTFRSEKDFFRGRFHRVVTVGSPQNGTRTLYYMRALSDHSSWASILAALPLGVVELMVQLDVAQNKFDPFGPEIREINAAPSSLWPTDPDAKFHIIRTTVNDGRPPDSTSSPSDLALGFNGRGGMLVLPRGSDGVVDWDSMGCHGPSGSAASNVFTISGEQIAHALAALFGGDDSQTASAIVARHARNALDQTGSTGDTRFGPFPLPPILPQSAKDEIDLWAALVTFDFGTSIRLLDTVGNSAPSRPLRGPTDSPPSIRVALDPSPGMAPIGAVNWTVEVYEHRGISSNRLSAFPDSADPFAATIDLPPDFAGQIVVYANYETDSDTIVMAAPFLALNVPPPGATVVGVQIIPSETALPAGSGVPVRVAMIYDTGEIRPAFVSAEDLTAQSSDPTILDVSDPNFWKLLRPGAVTVTGTFRGIPYTAELGVIGEGSALVDLNITLVPQSGPMITWPNVLDGFYLERSTDLTKWKPVTGTISEAFGFNSYIDDTGDPQAFYRLVPR